MDGSALSSSINSERMLGIGRNFWLARGGGKYARMVKECVLSTAVFLNSVTLSLLDLLGLTTVLNGGSAASEDAMVESAAWVINLRPFT